MSEHMSRRSVMGAAGMVGMGAMGLGAAGALGGVARGASQPNAATQPSSTAKAGASKTFTISLAQWSYHKALYGGGLKHADFPAKAKAMGIDAVEYVNVFFKFFKENKAGQAEEVRDLKKRCADQGVQSVLIMCDGEGALGDPDEAKRSTAVDNHRRWLDAAKELGCHSIRVNAQSEGGFWEQRMRAADGLRKLCEFADPLGLNVIVENHWGLSSNGAWLSGVMKEVAHPRAGTLPDFGNFDPKEYDRYQGVEDMMPFAKGVSAKSKTFNDKGEETVTDYARMLKLVMSHGYHGRVGIEFEGEAVSEDEGVRLTKALLEKVREQL